MQIIIPRRYDSLNRLWLPMREPLLQPQEVDPRIIYTSNWLPASMQYEQDFEFEAVDGADASVTVVGTTVPAGQFFFVPIASIRQSGASAKICELSLQHVSTSREAGIQVSGIARATTEREALIRPVIVPAAHRLIATVRAAVVGTVVTMEYFFIRGRWGEPIPSW